MLGHFVTKTRQAKIITAGARGIVPVAIEQGLETTEVRAHDQHFVGLDVTTAQNFKERVSQLFALSRVANTADYLHGSIQGRRGVVTSSAYILLKVVQKRRRSGVRRF